MSQYAFNNESVADREAFWVELETGKSSSCSTASGPVLHWRFYCLSLECEYGRRCRCLKSKYNNKSEPQDGSQSSCEQTSGDRVHVVRACGRDTHQRVRRCALELVCVCVCVCVGGGQTRSRLQVGRKCTLSEDIRMLSLAGRRMPVGELANTHACMQTMPCVCLRAQRNLTCCLRAHTRHRTLRTLIKYKQKSCHPKPPSLPKTAPSSCPTQHTPGPKQTMPLAARNPLT